jgi:hypothetical protein
MSQRRPVRYVVRNHQDQPIELHLPAGVLVLGPRKEGEIQSGDLAAPQLEALQRRRVITIHEVIEPGPKPDPEAGRRDKSKKAEA